MKERTKQLQSSGETRKTNRTWHFLSTLNSLLLSKLLLLLIIPAIGSTAAWATDEVVTIGSKNSGAFTIDGTSHAVAGVSGGTNSGKITAASDGQTASAGSKMQSTSNIGSSIITGNKQHVRFTVSAGETVRFYYYQTGGANKATTFATSDILQNKSYYHAAKEYTAASKNTLYFIDFEFADAGTYAISQTDGESVYMAALKFTASSAGSTPTLSSIAVSTAPTKTTYTAGETFNPAGLVIRKTMSDSSTSDVAYSGNEGEFAFSPTTSTALDASNTSVTITYGGKTTNQAITVNRITNTLALSTPSGSMNVGDSDKDISSYITNKNNTGTTVTYSSDAEGVATVSPSGAIHPVSAGTAHITVAQAQTNVYTAGSATYTVTVNAAATLYTVTFNANGHGTLSATSATQASPSEAVTLATVTPQDDTNHKYAFASWNTKADGSGSTISAPYVPTADITIYAQYTKTHHKVLSSVATGEGSVAMTDPSTSAKIESGSWVAHGAKINVVATPATGYQWNNSWGVATSTPTATLSNFEIIDTKDFNAHFTAKTYSITIDKNGGSAGGSATATYNSNKLTGISAPTYSGKVVEGYYMESGCTNKIADASGNLVASTTYTNSSSQWTNDAVGTVTLYANWEDAPAGVTSLPVTYDFRNTDKWTESGNIGTSGNLVELKNRAEQDNNHSFYIRKSADNKFTLEKGVKLSMNDNGSTSNFIAIPISGINGRIDIDVWSPYTSADEYTLRYVLDTSNGTTVQSSAPSDITKKKSANGWVTDHFNFRINNISATTTSGVLYIGRGESGFPDFYKIKITTPSAYLVPTPTSLTLGDAQTDTVVIKNYTPYNVRIKTYADEAIAKSFYDPVSNKLAIDAVAPGSTNVVLFADINGNGTEDSEEEVTRINIPITINGITAITAPSSAVYDTSGSPVSPALTDISITATHSSGAEMSYQWYKNTVNSNTGGTAISGATDKKLDKSKISTSATEDASFYYCVVSATNCKSKASDVAYVLTSKTKRYFQMSNVAGNKETSTNDEKITGQVIAGGQAYVQTDGDYRYITRPNTSVAHMYVANAGSKYFKVTLDNAIATGDVISVLLNGYLSDATGITIATDALGSNAITLSTGSDTSVKTYASTFTSAFNSLKTFYIKGIYSGTTANYFTDLIIYKPADLVVGAPIPASQTVQVGDTPETISVTASGGTGSYSYQWYSNTSNTATVDNAHKIADATSASYTPPTTAAVTTYYYCTVTSGGNTVTSTTAKVEVKAIEHGWHTPTFTNSVEVYALTQDNFEKHQSSPNFWTKETSVTYANIKVTPVSETKANYMQLKNSNNQRSMTFYVKNAIAFDMVAGDGSNNTSKKANIKVGTTKVGTLVNNQKWTDKFSLNADGDTITIDEPDGTIYLGALRFYMYSPIEVSRAGTVMERDTIYVNDTSVAYDVTSSRPGALSVTKPDGATGTATDYSTSTARVQFDAEHGVLTVSPIALGTETITIAQAASGGYPEITRTFTVVVAKHTLNLEFSLDEININASILTSGSAIPAGSLPTLHAYKDGVEVDKDDLVIKYMSDDVTIGSFADENNYTITYGGGQGGALIYAYVASSDEASSAKDYFGLNIKAGTSNALPSTAKAGEDKEIYEQKRFELQNDEGENVVTLVYGGYKYDKEGGWTNASSRGKYHIDGFKYYTRHDIDALDEYGYQLRGMSDESQAAPKSLELEKDMDHHDYSHTYHLSSWSSQNVGNHTFWYTKSELKPDGTNYKEYERIRPFTLPCYGGYLKFETHKTGTLTVYVWQNGSINAAETTDSKKLGTKPRLSYWFDQDGWVKQPKVAPITKQPITNSKYGHDKFCTYLFTEDALDDKWTEANGDKAIIPMLLRKYCNSEKTVFSNTQESGYIDNPYYWMTSDDIEKNLNEERTIIPKKMTPVPYHNGYMVPEESYLKYVIDVVAGKTYYFYGMMTKIGYVGMNFIEDNGVKAAYKVREVPTLHLNTNDNMETVVNSMGAGYDFAVYNEVTLPSNYRAGKWNTICLPFALSEQQVEEAFGKGTQLTLYNGLIKKGTDYTIKYLSHVDTNILPGQPYFIKPSGVDASEKALPTDENGILGSAVEGQTGTRITFNTVCIDKKQFSTTACKYSNDSDVDGSGAATGKDAGFELVGTYAKTAIDQYSYLINASTGNLRQYTGAPTSAANGLNTYHAFLRPKNADVKHNSLSQIDFEEDAIIEYAWLENGTSDTPTPVKTIEEEVVDALNSGKIVMPNKAYNLMGQEIDPRSAKGLVIINGKKVMY